MALHNTLTAPIRCPRCGACVPTRFDCDFGDTRGMLDLMPGDRYPWLVDASSDRGKGRPAAGNADGPAWALCPSCDYDYFATVRVREDVILEVVPDRSRFPQSFDASLAEDMLLPCARCDGRRDMEVRLYACCARPARRLRPGDRYEPSWITNVTTAIWAQGLCERLHETVVHVTLEAGVIAAVHPTDIDRWVRPSERGRALDAGPMFFEPPA